MNTNTHAVTMLSPYFHPHIGGIENYVQHLSSEMGTRGWDVTVLASSLRNSYSISTKEYRAFCFEVRLKPLNNPISPGILPALLRCRMDIIHVNGYYQAIAMMGMLGSKLRRKPMVLTLHGRPTYENPIVRAGQSLYERGLSLPVLRSFDYILVMNESDRSFVISMKYPEERVRYIPNAVDVDYWGADVLLPRW